MARLWPSPTTTPNWSASCGPCWRAPSPLEGTSRGSIGCETDLDFCGMVGGARWVVFGLIVLLATMTAALHLAMAAPSPTDAAAVRAEIARVYDWAGYQRNLPEPTEPRPRPQS